MASRRVISLVVVFSFLLVTSSFAITEQFTAGTGQNNANLYIEWNDGYSSQFTVSFDSTSITGLNLFDIVEASTGLTTARESYGSAVFIDGISFKGHSNIGYNFGANWWHYWVKDSDQQDWLSPAYGAGDRVIYNGDSDGWIYGRDTSVPEPVSIALFGIGGLILSRCRRQPRVN